MDLPGIVVAGLVGTTVITMLMYGSPIMKMPRMDIAQLIGSMVLEQGNAAFAIGMIVHYMMGIAFTAVYAAVWGALGNQVTWGSGLAFGLVHAMVAGVGIGILMTMHKEVKAGRLSSPLSGRPKGMAGMLMGHLAFGLAVALTYRAFV